MTSRLSRIPAISLEPVPSTSRMIEVRISARTNVGRTRKKSAMRIEHGVEPAADVAADDPEDRPDRDRDDGREQADDHRDPASRGPSG